MALGFFFEQFEDKSGAFLLQNLTNQVTNYTHYHKSVEKAWTLLLFIHMFNMEIIKIDV